MVHHFFLFQIWVFNCRGQDKRFFKKIHFKHIVCITPPSDSVIINLLDLYLQLKVICKFECPVRNTIESREVSPNSTHLSGKN